MSLYIIIEFLNILMKLHLHRIVVDDKLIDIWSNLFYLIDCKNKSVGRHENKAVRKFLPRILVSLNNLGIKKGLIISVKCKMSLISPVCKLINDILIYIVVNLRKRSALRMNIGCTECACGITSVDSLNIYNIGHRNFLGIKEVITISLLRLTSCKKL